MKQIILVEDDPVLLANLKEALEVQGGYQVYPVANGMNAAGILQMREFDCAILDVNLPGKNGFELCKHLRGLGKTTPVLMLTAFDQLEDKVAGFEAGADDYLTKPFFTKELLMRVQALLKRSAQSRDTEKPVLQAGSIEIHLKTKTVYRSGEEIFLTPREYQVLKTLIQAEGEVVTKQDLIREIWGKSFDANTNTVEVYINFLRKKIDKPYGSNTIKTKIGYGYYFEAE